eukprot:CAMPEP_0184319840 /NCGR_PEP_ID=MMETSP1049-20130417/110868_1 /TAXON_ID=77928 /ORGANISM="Proteomonas sulcata, Strain CCMP704" /LENGTH=116 /DNA_ID=CAMNT_0026640153 /DNA_START=160 /DNA_END=507 /DNA_ORIENTATION=+
MCLSAHALPPDCSTALNSTSHQSINPRVRVNITLTLHFVLSVTSGGIAHSELVYLLSKQAHCSCSYASEAAACSIGTVTPIPGIAPDVTGFPDMGILLGSQPCALSLSRISSACCR